MYHQRIHEIAKNDKNLKLFFITNFQPRLLFPCQTLHSLHRKVVLYNLFFVAEADGELASEEIEMLRNYATIFGLSPEKFARIMVLSMALCIMNLLKVNALLKKTGGYLLHMLLITFSIVACTVLSFG